VLPAQFATGRELAAFLASSKATYALAACVCLWVCAGRAMMPDDATLSTQIFFVFFFRYNSFFSALIFIFKNILDFSDNIVSVTRRTMKRI